jgi:hypothetical protein
MSEWEDIIKKKVIPFLQKVDKNPDKAYTFRITARKGRVTGFQTVEDEPNK